MTLLFFVALYLLCSVAIGLYAASKVRNTLDYAVAGRALPLFMVVATTFDTWFGSETVLGVPSKFVEGGLSKTVEDPFAASLSLILVGLFFSRPLYRMNLLTIGDFYRERYGRGVEVFSAVVIMVSYLGWVAAQITALGLVFSLLTEGVLSLGQGMVVGTLIVLVYTVFGGMWSVAFTDLLQVVVIVVGLSIIAIFAADLAGGPLEVLAYASAHEMCHPFPEGGGKAWLFWLSSAITYMIGSIPQQDVFQRIMSARDPSTAAKGPIIGGIAYLLFAFVPVFVALSAFSIMPEEAISIMQKDPQKVLPTLILTYMPRWLQVLFFGALLSAIMSTASATLLAPSTTFVENVLKDIIKMDDKEELRYMRLTLLIFTSLVLAYSLHMEGTPIYELVAKAYEFPVVGAFWPLVFGLYSKRASKTGAVLSIFCGMGTWAVLEFSPLGEIFPSVLGGLLLGGLAMLVGSYGPKYRCNKPKRVKEEVLGS